MPLVETYPTTIQEAFDRVWQAFVVEERPRCLVGNTCAYRNEDNTHACGIGWMIPDDCVRDPKGVSVFLEIQQPQGASQLTPLVNSLPHKFLFAMQHAHDDLMSTEHFTVRMERSLRRIAREYSLRIPEGDTP